MKMKRISAIACAFVTLILIAVSCLTVFAAGDISGAIESTWNDAKSQIESVVNNVVFPVLDQMMMLLSAIPDIEVSCTDSSECFDDNKLYLKDKADQEGYGVS